MAAWGIGRTNQRDNVVAPLGDRGQEKFHWCSVAPIVFRKRPFGNNGEGFAM